AEWYGQSFETYDGSAAGRSGLIGHNGVSWVETTVEGPGELTFRWKVSSESGYDVFRFALDGVEIKGISGEVNWREESFRIPPGEHALRWAYMKDEVWSEGVDAGWLDEVSYSVVDLVPLGETLSAPENPVELVWTTGGDVEWYGQSAETYDGSAA